MRSSTLAAAVGLLGVFGCDGNDAALPPGDDPPVGDDVLEPGPPPGGQQLASDEYTLAPSDEKYYCYTFHSPAEQKAITRVEPIQGQYVHHVALFQTTSPEPEGFHECPQIISFNWQPIWAGGAGAASLDLPQDVGFVIQPNTQYLVQYHLQNTGDTPITERSGINLTYVDATTVTPAGLFALGTFSLTIPTGEMMFPFSISCAADRLLNVFAVFPHMHKLGKKIHFEVGTTEEDREMVYSKDPWEFGEQPMDPVDLTIESGQYLRATCFWNNDTGHDVTFGESSDNEMCFFVLFYYPFEELSGCIVN